MRWSGVRGLLARELAVAGVETLEQMLAGGATGCEMGAAGRTVEGRNGGTLTPHPPGSNGGVHRGPSRFPGRNVVRAMLMKALVADGPSLEDLRRERKHRKGHALIPTAMVEHCLQGYKNIAIAAARGKPEAYGPFLRMMDHAHMIFQPAKDEVARAQAQDRVPTPTNFIRPPQTPEPPPEKDETPPPADGQEYV